MSERKKKKKKKDKERERETEEIHEDTNLVATTEEETREERKKRKKERKIKAESEQNEEEETAATSTAAATASYNSSLLEEEKLALLRDVELSFGKSSKKQNKSNNNKHETPAAIDAPAAFEEEVPEAIIKLELSPPKKARSKTAVKPEPVNEQNPTSGTSKKSKTSKQLQTQQLQLSPGKKVAEAPLSKEFCDDSSSSGNDDKKPSELDLEEKRQQLLNSIAIKQLGKGTPKKNKKKDVGNETPAAEKSKKNKSNAKQNKTVEMAPSFMVPTSTPAPKVDDKSTDKPYDSSKDSLIMEMMMKYQKKPKKSKKSK